MDEGYYARDAESPDGYKNQCKKCDKYQDERDCMDGVMERVAELDGCSVKLLEELSKGSSSVSNLPHASTVLEDLVTLWGGSMGFAKRCHAEYLAAKPGSMIRQRYNLLLAKMVLEASSQGYVQPPLEKLSDQEIEKLYRERKKNLKLRLVNGEDLSDTG